MIKIMIIQTIKKLLSFLIWAFALLSATNTALAYDGNELYKDLRGQGFVEGFAWGRITGFAKAFADGGFLGTCLTVPEGTSNEQFVDVVKLYLQNNPQIRQRSAQVIIHNSLVEAYGRHSPKSDGWCY
ncbi:Rap1a/Tai family immunity protein [Litoricola sp.]|nr:Rap1a/Tai family immunity protein [Litorivicinus sp.]